MSFFTAVLLFEHFLACKFTCSANTKIVLDSNTTGMSVMVMAHIVQVQVEYLTLVLVLTPDSWVGAALVLLLM